MNRIKYEFEKSIDPFFDTPQELIQKKLELLELKDGETIVELGCGKANCLIEAASIAEIKGIGYEILEEALAIAKENVANSEFSSQIEIREENMFDADLSKANALILYFTRNVLGSLSLKLEKELPKGARIVTHDFDLPAWKAEKEINVMVNGENKSIYLYKK